MSQSVKLKDGSYIDASGVWDATQGKTQDVINARFKVTTLEYSVTGIANSQVQLGKLEIPEGYICVGIANSCNAGMWGTSYTNIGNNTVHPTYFDVFMYTLDTLPYAGVLRAIFIRKTDLA